jgi:hypothetical protein
MAISPLYGTATYLGANGANGTTVAGTRNKVANPITSTVTGSSNNPATSVSPAIGTANYSVSSASPVAGTPTPGSLNVNATSVGKEVQSGVYS